MAKKYTLKMTCPQCGCTDLTVLTEAQIKAKYGDDPKFRLSCGQCTLQYEAPRTNVCPEWDKQCTLKGAQTVVNR
jgi:hypothetical protein